MRPTVVESNPRHVLDHLYLIDAIDEMRHAHRARVFRPSIGSSRTVNASSSQDRRRALRDALCARFRELARRSMCR